MKSFCPYSQCSHLNILTIFPLKKMDAQKVCCWLFLTFNVLVANPKKTVLYTVANPARGLLNREKRTKEKVWQHTPLPPPPCSTHKLLREHKNKNTKTRQKRERKNMYINRDHGLSQQNKRLLGHGAHAVTAAERPSIKRCVSSIHSCASSFQNPIRRLRGA